MRLSWRILYKPRVYGSLESWNVGESREHLRRVEDAALKFVHEKDMPGENRRKPRRKKTYVSRVVVKNRSFRFRPRTFGDGPSEIRRRNTRYYAIAVYAFSLFEIIIITYYTPRSLRFTPVHRVFISVRCFHPLPIFILALDRRVLFRRRARRELNEKITNIREKKKKSYCTIYKRAIIRYAMRAKKKFPIVMNRY